MEGKKRSWFFKRLQKKESSIGSGRLKFLWSAAFKWKRLTNLPASFMDNVVFKVVSAFEAILLVLSVSFFYLCCGCKF